MKRGLIVMILVVLIISGLLASAQWDDYPRPLTAVSYVQGADGRWYSYCLSNCLWLLDYLTIEEMVVGHKTRELAEAKIIRVFQMDFAEATRQAEERR
jgi:hypothetical protein